MKILPKKVDIDKFKAQEQKRQIDDGLALAKKVDALREAKLTEEKNLNEWRDKSVKEAHVIIDSLLEDQANLLKSNTEARLHREELLKPLNKEWEVVSTEKALIQREKELISKSKESLKEQTEKIKREMEKVSEVVVKLKKKEIEIEKTKQNTSSLNELAQREYERARSEREVQTEAHEKALSEVRLAKEAYENGLKVYEIHEKEVKEKESELIIREKHLESQQQQLRNAKELLNK